MKNVWNIVWCAAVALTLSGCTKEIIEKRGDGTTGSGKTFPATVEFSVPEMLSLIHIYLQCERA